MKRTIFILCVLTLTSFYVNGQDSFVANRQLNDSLINQLKQGSSDLSLILDLFHANKTINEDSLNKLYQFSNRNYIKNTKSENINLDIALRDIYFSDQKFRIKCYYHGPFDYRVVVKNDSLLQIKFCNLITDHSKINMFQNQIYQMTFDLLLIHSVTSLHTNFFKNNFHIYSNAFSNDFIEFEGLRSLMDNYLKFKYQKQYFGTDWGKDRLENKSFGLLPKMTKEELHSIFVDLNVKDPKI